MLPEIRQIQSEKELEKFLPVVVNSFLTVSEEFGITEESAPSNPAFMTLNRLIDIYYNNKCFGVYHERLPIGFFVLEESGKSILLLEKLSILPDFRHRGYGEMILDYAVHFGLKNNFNKISIAIINKNQRLKTWYAAYGFSETKIKVFPHLPFDVCFMEFNINSINN